MKPQIKNPRDLAAGGGNAETNQNRNATTDSSQFERDFLLTLLEGQSRANAMMSWGKPGPILLPNLPAGRAELIRQHLFGLPETLIYSPCGSDQRERVPAVALAGLCPGDDGRARWLAIDLDAADGHGAKGLVDPVRAAACVAERAHDAHGLGAGVVVARSRSGKGRHVFIIPPAPVTLDEAVLAVAYLAASARRVADRDAREYGGEHAFRCGDGRVARPGESGAFELIPYSTNRPANGWAIALPLAGAYRMTGAGRIVDPFSERGVEVELQSVPRCDPWHWARFIREARLAHARRTAGRVERSSFAKNMDSIQSTGSSKRPLDRIDARTREFIDGRTPEGGRNRACHIAMLNLIGCGVPATEAEHLVLQGAHGCGLSEREAKAAIKSALRRKAVR